MYLLKDKLNIFFVLAFIPLLYFQYFGYVARGDLFGAMLPLYGFLLLLIKKDTLSLFPQSGRVWRFVGIIFVLASMFVYFPIVFFYPEAQYFGVANYCVYLVGLFLVFFQVSALKQLLPALFLIVGVTASGFVGEWMEIYLEPAVPFFVQIMAAIMMVLGIPASLEPPTTFLLRTLEGSLIPVRFAAGCIGIWSFLTFAILIVAVMMEDTSSLRTKVLWSIVGIIGTFFVNIVRASLILVVIYYFGYEGWGQIHTPLGYVLFFVWLALFFLVFLKRQVILDIFQTLWRKFRQL